MRFDRERVLTLFTAHKAKKGDWGWIGDYPNELADSFEKREPALFEPKELIHEQLELGGLE